MKFFKNHKSIVIKGSISLFLIILFIIFIFLKNNQEIAENWSRSFVNVYINIFGYLTKIMPFSLLEVSAVLVITFAIIFIVLIIINLVKKRFIRSLSFGLNILLIVSSFLASYQLTAEMMYNRKPVEVPLYENWVEKENFKTVINYFLDDLTDCCNHLNFLENGDLETPDLNEINNNVNLEYAKFNSDYLFNFSTHAKPMYLSSWLYREFHITGITYIPLGEANVNILNVNAGKGFTLAHELAHTKGAMREEDADLVASYITLHSSNYYLRYSGYYYTISSLLNLAQYTGIDSDYQEVYNKLDTRFKKNINFNNKYWREHNKASEFATWWNNLYLKMSGEKEGTSSYGDSSTSIDQVKKEIKAFSNYQKLNFDIFYNKN